jgi:proteasome assembly chaperone (PAC2) family protein
VDSELRIKELPTLRRPVLICAFSGWNDGGQGATMAVEHLVRVWDATPFADIDPEGFMDFQATRPTVVLDEGRTRRIEWPENELAFAAIPGADRDAVLLSGVEPSYRWRAFCGLITGLAHDLGVDFVVTLGALLADVPHTRPAPVTGAATDPKLVEELGLELSRYEGPTGIVGVLLDACRRAERRSASLWAAVPHYVSLAPSPRAARALLAKLGEVLALEIDLTKLKEAEEEYARHVSEAVASDADTQAYVEELERRSDSIDRLTEGRPLPSGDAIAAELSRFLREREEDDAGDAPSSPPA